MKKYVISDIHGQYHIFKTLIDKLEKDNNGDYLLYIIGDILDRGDGGYDIFKAITSEPLVNKVKLIKGNHEKMFCDFINFTWANNYDEIAAIYFRNGTIQTIGNIIERVIEELPTSYLLPKQNYPQEKIKVINTIWRQNGEAIETFIQNKGVKTNSKIIKYILSKTYDKMIEMADYFEELPTYVTEDGADKFLLIHSGFVNAPRGDLHYNLHSDFVCKTIEELKDQKESVLLSCRKSTTDFYGYECPKERFCEHVIVCGHTSNSKYNQSRSFDTVFHGKKLASICLDGTVFLDGSTGNRIGQLNCLCLDDLSQIIIKNQYPYKPLEVGYGQEKE